MSRVGRFARLVVAVEPRHGFPPKSALNLYDANELFGIAVVSPPNLSAAFTVIAYIVGGIIAALIFRRVHRAARTASGGLGVA